MIRTALIFLSLFFLSGCAYFSKKFESLAQNNKNLSHVALNTKNNFCSSNKLQYISEDEHSLKFYRSLHPVLFENKSIPFVQKALMLSLIEMSRRPDEASPYSRLQVYLKLNGQSYYFDFRPKNLEDDTKMPYLRGLEYLSQKFLNNQSLSAIAEGLDKVVPKNIVVSTDFENFLRENRTEILKNDFLTERFLKGDEILTKFESFNRPNYKSIVAQYQALPHSKASDYEFNINGLDLFKSEKNGIETNCNVDLSKESSLRDDLLSTEAKHSHYIGLSEGQDFFLATSSTTLHRPFLTSEKFSYFMKARPAPLPIPICQFKGPNQEIVLFSSNGRNPIQHLQHLVAYEIGQIDSSFTLNELLNFSRHLFLTNPDRILYESKRGRKAQLDFFLAMNFPIYHIESLGNIFGYAAFKNDKKLNYSLHIDDRSHARLWCGQ